MSPGIFIYYFVYMVINALLPNHIVTHIPSNRFRIFYYKYILNNEIHKYVYIAPQVYIYPCYKQRMVIGKRSVINRNSILDGRGGLYIGENVNISNGVAIYTGGHVINSKSFSYYNKKVEIGNRVWLCSRCMIMPGVTIEDGAVVLPGAVVTHDVPAFSIVGGIPARVMGYREKDLEYCLQSPGYFM